MSLRPLCSVDGCDCPASLTLTSYPSDVSVSLCMFHERSYLLTLVMDIDRLSRDTGMVHLPWAANAGPEKTAVPGE